MLDDYDVQKPKIYSSQVFQLFWNLIALIFVIQNALGGGVNSSLRLDRHGKTLSSYLLYNLILDVSLDMMPDNSPYREKFK